MGRTNAKLKVMPLMSWVDRSRLIALRMRGVKRRFVDTSVGRISVLDLEGKGDGPPVLLLHGLGSAAIDYGPLFKVLKASFRRIIAPDVPGHGWSDVPEQGMRPELLRAGLWQAVDQVLDEPAIVFGNSLGGLAAIRYAQLAPERVLGLFLVSPGGAPMDATDLSAFLDHFRLASHRQALGFVDRFLGRPNRLRQVLAMGARARMARPQVRELLDRICPHHLLSAKEIGDLDMPVLLFWGQGDGVLPEEHLGFFQDHLPDHAELHNPDGYGHAPYLDQLSAFTSVFCEFAAHLVRGPETAGA